ncbi:MAG TPA: DnaJ domain-containing protein, partial [Dokdonella sp.]|nr:DnaJ domain-containing protein [Dokdonella sp.]
VRFYLQQALFDPGTDAYRVLGLAPDAPAERVRQHYRWLQRWLHPDRLGDEWESVYAKRVNWAWRQLRNAESRDAYDRRRELGSDEPPTELISSREGGAWKAVPFARSSWPKRIVLGLWVASVALLVLAVVRLGAPPADEPALAASGVPAAVPADLPAPAIDAPAASMRVLDIATSPPVAATRIDRRDADAEPARAGRDPPRVRRFVHDVRTSAEVRVDAGAFAPPGPLSALPESTVADASILASPNIRRVRESASAGGAVAPSASVDAPAVPGGEATGAFVATEVELGRFDTAEERLAEICRYFGHLDAPTPPIWNDLGTQLAAERARAALHERGGASGEVRFEVATPDWRLSDDAATLSAGYRLRSGHEARESGLLTLSMVWRVRMWLVSHVELRPDP